MKGVIFAFAVSSFLTSTKGECSAYDEDSLVTSCEGATKYGPVVHVDFHKINRPCTCIVTPLFVGDLIVMSREVVVFVCNTQVTFQNSFIFRCPSHLSAQKIRVTMNQSFEVRAEYESPFISGTFYHCLGFYQNDGLNGNLSVICGSPLATQLPITTASTTTPTIITTPSTASSRLLSVVSSTESTVTIQNNVNVIESTDTTMSEENTCICGRKDEVTGESHLSLQIPLAIFVVISMVSSITNIYFYIHIKLRKKSGSNASNVKVSFQTRTETTAETYTELGNTVSENQYDSLSGQDDYMNTNVS